MAARPTFDPDSPYITHPRAAVVHYAPLPETVLRQLARLERLMHAAPCVEEIDWLEAQAALVMAECVDCAPIPVRNTQPLPVRKPRKAVWFKRGRRS